MENSFFNSPIFIFILTLVSGILGFYIKSFIDYKKAKKIKIKSLYLKTGVKYGNGSYVPLTLDIQVENLSSTKVEIKHVNLKCSKDIGMSPIKFIPISNDNFIDLLEIKNFSYEGYIEYISINPKTSMIDKIDKVKIISPEDFVKNLVRSFTTPMTQIKSESDFEKKIDDLGVFIQTNIGNYYRKFTKKERKMFFKGATMTAFREHFNDKCPH